MVDEKAWLVLAVLAAGCADPDVVPTVEVHCSQTDRGEYEWREMHEAIAGPVGEDDERAATIVAPIAGATIGAPPVVTWDFAGDDARLSVMLVLEGPGLASPVEVYSSSSGISRGDGPCNEWQPTSEDWQRLRGSGTTIYARVYTAEMNNDRFDDGPWESSGDLVTFDVTAPD